MVQPSSKRFVTQNQVESLINTREVACAIRNTGSGFAFIDDATHKTLGVSSISQGAEAVTINYDFTATQVISLVVTPDDTFAKLGYTVGASVGLSSATINFAMPAGAVDYVTWGGSAWTSFTGFVTSTTMNGTTGLITMNHATVKPAAGGVVQLRTNGDNRISQEGMGEATTNCFIYPFNSNVSLKAPTTDIRIWLYRAGARMIAPTELTDASSNFWIRGIFEV